MVSSQPALEALTFQQAAEHLQALRDVGVCSNQPQFTASIFQVEEFLETEQCGITKCFKQTTIDFMRFLKL